MSDSMGPHRRQPTRLPGPWDSPCKNTGVVCHFLLQCSKVKSESEVAQSCPTFSNPMDCSPPGSSIHGIFQARVLVWGAIAFSAISCIWYHNKHVKRCGHLPALRSGDEGLRRCGGEWREEGKDGNREEVEAAGRGEEGGEKWRWGVGSGRERRMKAEGRGERSGEGSTGQGLVEETHRCTHLSRCEGDGDGGGKLGVTMPLEGSTGTFSGPVTLHTWHRLSRPGLVGPSLPHPWPQAQGCMGCLPTSWPAPDLWASCEPLTQGAGGPRDLVA